MQAIQPIRKGFTLIELLIVVAIIAILAAIAVPNFLEAQMRAKVSRVKADMRSTKIAIEAYRVDSNAYMPDAYTLINDLGADWGPGWTHVGIYKPLTSPVAYMTSMPQDVFYLKTSTVENRYFAYQNFKGDSYATQWRREPRYQDGAWVNEGVRQSWNMYSLGPNMIQDGADYYPVSLQYDPTNGTVSAGDVSTWGP
jgi:prepilin-type N-terminal cleavage/methylation domain-containing protein